MRYEAYLDGTVLDTLTNIRYKYPTHFEARMAIEQLNEQHWLNTLKRRRESTNS